MHRYACSWRRLSPSTDGISGEGKDLWIFYFTTLPDLTGRLATQLKGTKVYCVNRVYCMVGYWIDKTN